MDRKSTYPRLCHSMEIDIFNRGNPAAARRILELE
jgi:hypothetical protein